MGLCMRCHGFAIGGEAKLGTIGNILGFEVVGCEPDEMGIGPVFAVSEAAETTRHQSAGRRSWR